MNENSKHSGFGTLNKIHGKRFNNRGDADMPIWKLECHFHILKAENIIYNIIYTNKKGLKGDKKWLVL